MCYCFMFYPSSNDFICVLFHVRSFELVYASVWMVERRRLECAASHPYVCTADEQNCRGVIAIGNTSWCFFFFFPWTKYIQIASQVKEGGLCSEILCLPLTSFLTLTLLFLGFPKIFLKDLFISLVTLGGTLWDSKCDLIKKLAITLWILRM